MNQPTLGITGSGGLIGQALAKRALKKGYSVVLLRHRESSEEYLSHQGSTETRLFNEHSSAASLKGIDVLIHLAGESLMQLWTSEAKKRIWRSRVDLTQHLASLVQSMDSPPKHIISASGIGIYGDREDEELVETSPSGQGFLADLCVAWEQPLVSLSSSKICTHQLRTSLVLAKQAPAWKWMSGPYRLRLGRQLGDADSWMSWIHLEDYLNLVFFLIESKSCSGPVNVSAPEPLQQMDFHRVLEEKMGKSFVPQFSLKPFLETIFPDQSQMLLNGQRVIPSKVLKEGFHFRYPTLKSAVENLITSPSCPQPKPR